MVLQLGGKARLRLQAGCSWLFITSNLAECSQSMTAGTSHMQQDSIDCQSFCHGDCRKAVVLLEDLERHA